MFKARQGATFAVRGLHRSSGERLEPSREVEHDDANDLPSTYDGESLVTGQDDELPSGPCGRSVNDLKRRFYKLCRRLDQEFEGRKLTPEQRTAEARFVP